MYVEYIILWGEYKWVGSLFPPAPFFSIFLRNLHINSPFLSVQNWNFFSLNHELPWYKL